MPDGTALAVEQSRPVALETKFSTDSTGELSGYGAVFGNLDAAGDVIAPGAFARSLAEHRAAGTAPAMFLHHDVTRPVGVWTDLREDDRGLLVAGRLTLDARDGADAHALLRSGALNGLSIGYRVRDFDRRPGGGRLLKDIELVEISIVSLPANTQARVTSVKGVDMEDVEVKAAPESEGADVAAALAEMKKISDRLDKIEIRANRPGAATVETKADDGMAVFAKFVRAGREVLDHVEAKAMTVSDDTTGGFLAPEAFVGELLKNVVLYSPIRQLARVMPMSTGSTVLPRRTSGSTAHWVSETETRTGTQAAYGQVRYTASESACYVDVSNVMLEDAAIDVASELSLEFAEEFGRLEGAAFVNGDGVNKPFGFMQNSDVAYTPSGSASAIAGDALIDLFHAIPAAYRGNGTWLMNSTTLAAVRKLKTGDGQYLVTLGGLANAPATTILGRPVVEAPDMPDVGAGTYPIVFGDFQQGYRIFDRVQLAVLRDPFSVATSGLVRFHARRRVAGGVAKAEAIRKLKISVS